MRFPSTLTANAAVGAIVSNIESSHGVRLTGGSTGGVVEAFGDDANISLAVRGQGTGSVVIGNSSQSVLLGNSTTSLSAVQRYLVQWTVPALSSASSAESTVTVAGLTTNAVLVLQHRVKLNSTVTGVTVTARCSTAAELTIETHNISQSSLSGSTQSAYLLAFYF